MPFRPTLKRAAWLIAAGAPLVAGISAEAVRAQSTPAAATVEYFEANVRPVLAANCYDCHTDQAFGGLRLDSREGLLRGGASGPAIVPGDPDKSLMIQAVRQTSDKLKMPKGGRLRPDEVDGLVEWVRAGALWPASAAGAATAARPAAGATPTGAVAKTEAPAA